MVIKDVWHSLLLAWKNFFFLTIIFLLGIWLFPEFSAPLLILEVIVFFQSALIYFKNSKYIIDKDKSTFTFPRSDIENSILAIIVGSRYWNLMRTIQVDLTSIENTYIDTKRWSTSKNRVSGYNKNGTPRHRNITKKHVRYTLNVTGSFGGANLSFLSRQKRDEVRNMLQQEVKKTTGRNIDRKVSEFG